MDVPGRVPAPMAFRFGGWKDSLFGDFHIHGPEGVTFYSRTKVVTSRWPEPTGELAASFGMPTATWLSSATRKGPLVGRPRHGDGTTR
jgi:hypothetical protein